MLPRVSIIILNWNGWKDTIECTVSVLKINYPSYEIVIVDNGSTDESIQRISERFPDIKLIKLKENLFYAGGNNVGICYALESGAKYTMLLNNDTTVHPDFLNPLVEAMENDPSIGAVGGTLFYYNSQNKIQNTGQYINFKSGNVLTIGDGETDINQFSKKRDVDYICGAAIMLRSEVVRKIGGLDENFMLYSEESDWCLRAKKIGYKSIFVPNSKVFHKGCISAKLIKPMSIYLLTRNKIWLIRRHAKVLDKLIFHLSGLIYRYPKFIFGRLYRKEFKLFYPAIRGVIDGYMAMPSLIKSKCDSHKY
jgi:GT2 family glycosyltransferase